MWGPHKNHAANTTRVAKHRKPVIRAGSNDRGPVL